MGSQDLFLKTYHELKGRILCGIYPHEYHLVVRSLAKELGVGVAVIRRALEKLESERLTINQPGKGFFVHCPHDMEDVISLRNELELAAIEQVAARIENESLKDLMDLAAEADRAKSIRDRAQYVNAEMTFHGKLVSCSENQFLITMHKQMQDHMKQYLSNYYDQLFFIYQKTPDVFVLTSHQMVVEAVQLAKLRKDPELAVKMLQLHMAPVQGVLDAMKRIGIEYISDSNPGEAGKE